MVVEELSATIILSKYLYEGKELGVLYMRWKKVFAKCININVNLHVICKCHLFNFSSNQSFDPKLRLEQTCSRVQPSSKHHRFQSVSSDQI